MIAVGFLLGMFLTLAALVVSARKRSDDDDHDFGGAV